MSETSELQLPEGVPATSVSRYSRQMLVKDIGGPGQAKISKAKALVVGAGGLGCAVLPSLAGAGIGTLGIIDPDVVETSNLHRQCLHRHLDAGTTNKAISAARFVRDLNPLVNVVVYEEAFDAHNAMEIVSLYDIVVDASDNPRTRYLLSDACVLLKKPLISGSAIGLEGQLTVYNFAGGPCYRCVYPNPPLTAASCSDNGVVGPVPAVIGHLEALEALKVLAGFGEVLSGTLVMYDARSCTFHRFKTPPRCGDCAACGASPEVCSMEASAAFCEQKKLRGIATGGCSLPLSRSAATPVEEVSSAGDRRADNNGKEPKECADLFYEQGWCSPSEYRGAIRSSSVEHVLLDVRDSTQFGMCSLAGSLNIPLTELHDRVSELEAATRQRALPVFVICRRGVASQKATALLAASYDWRSIDILGGYAAWSEVDPSFPSY